MSDIVGCLGCDLSSGRQPLPGGSIYEAGGWLVEHCVGPLGVGTLIVKPQRHVERLADLTAEEAFALGPLLHLATGSLQELLAPDQTYVCQWSHMGWTPGHLHFVVQPSWNHYSRQFDRPGPFMQADMFAAGELPNATEVERFADSARDTFRRLAAKKPVS